MKLIPTTRTACFNYSILGIFILLIGIFLIFMPKYWDDYDYMKHFAYWYHQQDIPDATQGGNIFTAGIPWDAIKQTWQERWLLDNVRFGNLFATIMLLFPKWLGSSLSLIAWIYVVYASFSIAGINIKKSSLVSYAIIGWTFFIPWQNSMGMLIYQYNYILPLGLSLFLLRYLNLDNHKKEEDIKNNNSIVHIAKVFILSFIVGGWHESFSIPILCGLTTTLCFCKETRQPYFYFSLFGLMIGILILAFAPGSAVRFEAAQNINDVKLINILFYNILYYLFLFLSVFYSFRHDSTTPLKNKLWIFCLISGMMPIAISIFTVTAARVTIFTQIISIIGIFYIAKKFNISGLQHYTKKNLLFLIPIILLCFARFVTTDIYVFKIKKLFSESIHKFTRNPQDPVFAEIWTRKDFPIFTLDLPDINITDHLKTISQFLGEWNNHDYKLKFIPKELKFITPLDGSELESNLNIKELQGRFFMPTDKNDYFKDAYTYLFKVTLDKKTILVPGTTFYFKSTFDNSNYVYINLHLPWKETYFAKIKGIYYDV